MMAADRVSAGVMNARMQEGKDTWTSLVDLLGMHRPHCSVMPGLCSVRNPRFQAALDSSECALPPGLSVHAGAQETASKPLRTLDLISASFNMYLKIVKFSLENRVALYVSFDNNIL